MGNNEKSHSIFRKFLCKPMGDKEIFRRIINIDLWFWLKNYLGEGCFGNLVWLSLLNAQHYLTDLSKMVSKNTNTKLTLVKLIFTGGNQFWSLVFFSFYIHQKAIKGPTKLRIIASQKTFGVWYLTCKCQKYVLFLHYFRYTQNVQVNAFSRKEKEKEIKFVVSKRLAADYAAFSV